MQIAGVSKGRGATLNRPGRFERLERKPVDDGWGSLAAVLAPLRATELSADSSRSIIARNTSPDIPFDQSINPYRGCEHGCNYCYARPTHHFLGLSAGLDFETRIFIKHDAAELLKDALARPGYRPTPLALGSNTDPYQPVERRLQVTRRILEILADARHPVSIVTKSALVVRDLDLLVPMAREGLASVAVSLTTLDGDLARRLEPRAAAPHRRLATMRELSSAGVPTSLSLAPVIPGLTDHEIERIVEAAVGAGATAASWILLRLPHDVKELFEAWLETHVPDRKSKVLSLVRQCRDGQLNDAAFGSRMRGQGPVAELIRRRFDRILDRLGIARRTLNLRTDLFRAPGSEAQLGLFDAPKLSVANVAPRATAAPPDSV
jgi:DNA repair photolyase